MDPASAAKSEAPGKGRVTGGWVLSGVLTAFMLFDAITKIIREPHVVAASAQAGYPAAVLPAIGIILLICNILFLVPRTLFWGALFLTAYLGGAVATGVRIEAPAFNIIFPIVFCVLVWVAALLRDPRLRSLL